MKACHECRNYKKERSGPHEWIASCALNQIDFLDADRCGYYQPDAFVLEDEGEHWPYRSGGTQ
ncbi:MAG TPA: hypothetical protein PKY50_06000 [Candidatus Competibacter sp.]|nr:hypothetical protein [Candidatus Competibacter sp.]